MPASPVTAASGDGAETSKLWASSPPVPAASSAVEGASSAPGATSSAGTPVSRGELASSVVVVAASGAGTPEPEELELEGGVPASAPGIAVGGSGLLLEHAANSTQAASTTARIRIGSLLLSGGARAAR